MQLTARETELLQMWRRTCVYAKRRLAHADATRVMIKRIAVNNERLKLIDKLLKEAQHGKR